MKTINQLPIYQIAPPRIARRSFLGGLAAGIASTSLTGRLHAASPNGEVRVAVLGAGGKGSQLASYLDKTRGAKVVMVADPDSGRAESTAAPYHAKAVVDLREAIDSPDVDAVLIATCDHWHCLAAIWAIEAGKDVYVEKPLAHNQWEGRQVVEAAAKHGRIVQLGTQQRSDPMQAQIREFLHSEKTLGEIHYVQANRLGLRGPIGKRSEPLAFPKGIDRDLWFGPAAVEPLYRNQLHYDWHWDWNTGTGEMGNWGVHILDDVRNVAYQDTQDLPDRITVGGGRVGWDDAGQTPNVHFALLETKTFPTMIALSNLPVEPKQKGAWKVSSASAADQWPQNAPGSGYVVVCEGGFYLGQRGSGQAVDRDGKVIRKFHENTDMIAEHLQNFIDAVQTRDASILKAPIENGHFSTGWCNLSNVAFRAGESFSQEQLMSQTDFAPWSQMVDSMTSCLTKYGIDPQTLKSCPTLVHDTASERFVGDNSDAANQFLRREYRSGYEVKAIS
ncbi:Gfo/Idh/MocA family protein [Aporhodopirellula aestuarii]|uniref:Gfo/Idh/MocA family oxidoreductase n=1 Tax=Aporhodopirellula aestuarii TaxID=2950107 RepID=A0ABT0U5E8_9BACT|nr:Gfo/Idh/MocA family oxidoreductase [Aporhodopirellula aestuarii]MCM2371785.1 Gfo/Idh/MocA family oxidoreductase [Aporhodopirellula aestuarii]